MGEIEIQCVQSWNADEIVDLYRAGGWWKEEYDPAEIPRLIRGSFVFAVAVDRSTGRAVGMGRVISDGVSDGYVQDLVVLPRFRKLGIGARLLAALVQNCRQSGVTWIGLVAEPGTDRFYKPLGFLPLEGYVPLLLQGDD
jgi:GNAT superfamily N-acetyltransferase|nr:GNAT family N-acetyltransferase [uncultured Methanoregula sp.]